jgi:hypothetical protein
MRTWKEHTKSTQLYRTNSSSENSLRLSVYLKCTRLRNHPSTFPSQHYTVLPWNPIPIRTVESHCISVLSRRSKGTSHSDLPLKVSRVQHIPVLSLSLIAGVMQCSSLAHFTFSNSLMRIAEVPAATLTRSQSFMTPL